MSAQWPLMALTYLSIFVFAVGVALRIAKYARAPLHLRWELYPVPHEKGKGYGGSYYEEVDWWAHRRETSLVGEIRAMLEEVLLIRSLWHRNRSQWYASFPFHAGLYLLVGLVVLLMAGAAARATGMSTLVDANSPLRGGLQALTVAVGVVGLVSATFGCFALLWRRLTDPNLKATSTFSDYLNLLALLAAFASAGFAWATVDGSFGLLRGYLAGLLTLSPAPNVPPAVVAEVALASLLLIYLPFTHMTHFVAKYFTYHQVRWDDAPSRSNPQMLARIEANLARPVGWSGPHIQPDRSWAEAATEVK